MDCVIPVYKITQDEQVNIEDSNLEDDEKRQSSSNRDSIPGKDKST